MAATSKIIKVKPGISDRGYRVAIKDYYEPAVLEELAANSYDADATIVLVLLDSKRQELHILDDGRGFSLQAITQCGMLGGGDKQELDSSESKRPYLGAYGFGLKATANIATRIKITSISDESHFSVELDWTRLAEALKPDFEGFDLICRNRPRGAHTGTHIVLTLKNPTADEILDEYASALANLPDDNGSFRCMVGNFHRVHRDLRLDAVNFGQLRPIAQRLLKRGFLTVGDQTASRELRECEEFTGKDRGDSSVRYTIYFTGIRDSKVISMKPGLRGIYVRIHGRLLKQNFTNDRYTYPISKWVKFAAGLRVELSIDWLRGEISLARDSIKFANSKLEEQFKSALARVVSGFIQPQLKKLEAKSHRLAAREHIQRLDLAKKRSGTSKDVLVPGITTGFRFVPECDAELALLVANEQIMGRINSAYRLLDYNDKAPFDCLIYDSGRRANVFTELEPTLMEFLQHKNIPESLELIITWTLGKWRVGAKKKGVRFVFQLTHDTGSKNGHYKLLAFARSNSKKPTAAFPVVALDQVLRASYKR